jgi:hypothetical protein
MTLVMEIESSDPWLPKTVYTYHFHVALFFGTSRSPILSISCNPRSFYLIGFYNKINGKYYPSLFFFCAVYIESIFSLTHVHGSAFGFPYLERSYLSTKKAPVLLFPY